jgi:flagellar protein FlbD
MIILTRLGGHALAVNPDLIERAEVTPDTVVTMTDGHKFVIAESLDTLVERVQAWRAGVVAEAYRAVADADLLSAERSTTDLHGEPAGGPIAAQRVERLALVTGLAGNATGRGATVLPHSHKED